MGYFEIVYPDIVKLSTPTLLRKRKNLAWLNVLVQPIKGLYDAFTAYRLANLYRLNHNGQVCYLEAALNDVFDAVARRIYISDTFYAEAVYLYTDDELHPVYLYTDGEDLPVYLFSDDDVADADSENVFIVNVPSDVYSAEGNSDVRIRAVVDKYRLPSMSAYGVEVF